MRVSRRSAVAACALTAALGTVVSAAPADAATVRYVGLGDSYSSGDGAGSYTDSSCMRSSKAYPQLWANAHSPASFSFPACGGAKTGDVLNNQLGSVNSDTTLVSITIGGNDVGFSNIMQTCVLGSDSDCVNAVNAAKTQTTSTLPGALDRVFSAIRSKAPSARVVVLDYPHLYKLGTFCIGLSSTKHSALNGGADALDSAISAATSRAGSGFTFADVRSTFAGHELCSGDDWLHAVTIPINESYHPTATGQASGYLPALNAAVPSALKQSTSKKSS